MVIGQIIICDFCHERCLPYDFTIIFMTTSDDLHKFIFHNTLEKPCLKSKIEELRQKFPVAVSSHPPEQ